MVIMTGLIAGAVTTYNVCFEPLPPGAVVDQLLLEKSKRKLTVFFQGQVLKTYSVSLGWNPAGPKQFKDDGKTPEGNYIIDFRHDKSDYHLALRVSYPNRADIENARRHGKPAGSAIMIHGIKNGLGFLGPLHRLHDWTKGCIAVTDAEMDELWRAVPKGTRIEIRP